MSKSPLCQHTVSVMSAGIEFPAGILEMAGAEYAVTQQKRRRNTGRAMIQHGGEWQCFSTIAAVLEQLYRHQHRVDIVGEYVGGQFGKELTRMQISSASKDRKASKANTATVFDRHAPLGARGRTRCSNGRSLWSFEDVIHETACGVLFGAVDGLSLLAPSHWGDTAVAGSQRYQYQTTKLFGKTVRVRNWDGSPVVTDVVLTTNREFYCLDFPSGQYVKLVGQFSSEEYTLLNKVIAHNTKCSDEGSNNRIQFVSFNTKHSDKLCKVFGPDALRIVRIKRTLARQAGSCIWTAFGAATGRVIELEFGHTRELTDGLEETREDRRASRVIDMAPIDFMDEIAAKCTPLQKRILEMDMSTSIDVLASHQKEYYDQVISRLNMTLEKPISPATYYRNRKVVMDIAKEYCRPKYD